MKDQEVINYFNRLLDELNSMAMEVFSMDANEPAFPVDAGLVVKLGLTKRELFSALAMQGQLAAEKEEVTNPDILASWAVKCADSLIQALSKPAAG